MRCIGLAVLTPRSNATTARLRRLRILLKRGLSWAACSLNRANWSWPSSHLITAISIHPSNPDALLHYAQLLEQTERADEAVSYWKQYLQYDSRGPWSDHARNRIAESEKADSVML
jgi:hypothetical protein